MSIVLEDMWKKHCQKRCEELHPYVFGSGQINQELAMSYFKFAQVLFEQYGLGTDYSQHPRNPFNKNFKKELDTNTKIMDNENMDNQEIIKFLQEQLEILKPRVFGTVEPSTTDRMTYFAYNQFLKRKFGVGEDLKFHPRNPWRGIEAPLDFSEYQQIRALPSNLQDNKKTQVLPDVIIPKNDTPKEEIKFRVFDVDYRNRTVFEGTESQCHIYAAAANKDMGYKGFDYEKTNILFVPRDKNKTKVIQMPPRSSNVQKITTSNACGCSSTTYKPKPLVKSRIQDYLTRCKKENSVVENTQTQDIKN